MTEPHKLIQILDEMIVHPIIREVLTDEINNGIISSEDQLKIEVYACEEELGRS